MGIVSSVVGLIIPAPRPRLAPAYYSQGRFSRTSQFRSNYRNQPNNRWLRKANRLSPSPRFRSAPQVPRQVQARRSFARPVLQPTRAFTPRATVQARNSFIPPVSAQRKPSLFGSLFSQAGSMLSTTYTGPMPNTNKRRQGLINGFFSKGRKYAMMSSVIRR